MAKTSLAGVVSTLRDVESILIATHTSPDGDAIGSMLALYHLLRAMNKSHVYCVSHDHVPKIYQWLPGTEQILCNPGKLPKHDLAVVADVSRLNRIGDIAAKLESSVPVMIIDHHLDEQPDGSIQFIDSTYAAVGEIVVELFEAAGLSLPPEAATCAYVAQATDTGGFRFSNTLPRSHRIAATLLETGLDVAAISARIFDVMPPSKFRLLAYVLNKTVFDCDGRLAYAALTPEDLAAADAHGEDTDGLINFARNVEGVEVAILFRTLDANTTKVSFRSHGVFNSAKLLSEFGGGGHVSAAGATVHASLEETKKAILTRVRVLLGEVE